MELQWMGEYREFVEKLIKFGNAYAQNYTVEKNCDTAVEFSAAQLQVMEYIMEHENLNCNMAELAAKLGVTPSSFSKNVRKMMDKGLLEKYRISNNRKEIIVRVSEQGKQVYADYSRYAYNQLFEQIFKILDSVPPEHISKFSNILDISAEVNRRMNEPTLVKIE